jgi:hypothetical protein
MNFVVCMANENREVLEANSTVSDLGKELCVVLL